MVVSESLHSVEPGNFRTEPCPDRPVSVADIVCKLHFLAPIEDRSGVMDHLRVEAVGHFVAEGRNRKASCFVGRVDLGENWVKVEIVEMFGTATDLTK